MAGPRIVADKNADLLKFLARLEEKLDAPVLNGGFDMLFKKVDNIEKNVDKLNEAVFNPEKGLFVRVQAEKVETDHDVNDLVRRIGETEDKIKTYRKFAIGVGLSMATVVIKFIWDAISSHIIFH